MFESVVGTRMIFFDTNPIGRIINRFSNDIGNIDDLLPLTMFETIQVIKKVFFSQISNLNLYAMVFKC